jgi:hypothetical protein
VIKRTEKNISGKEMLGPSGFVAGGSWNEPCLDFHTTKKLKCLLLRGFCTVGLPCMSPALWTHWRKLDTISDQPARVLWS